MPPLMAGGQVLLNCNVAFTSIRDVSWRVCEWVGGDATPSALEQYSAAVRSGQLVACTATRPMVLWHFTPRAASHDDVFRSPPWHEIERGSQPVGRLSSTAARLLDTAVVNVIEARLLSLRSYVLLPPCSLAPASSLPLLRSGPSNVSAALHGTLGVEVVTFVQGEQLGIVAQVRRHSIVSVRPADLRKVRCPFASCFLELQRMRFACLIACMRGFALLLLVHHFCFTFIDFAGVVCDAFPCACGS